MFRKLRWAVFLLALACGATTGSAEARDYVFVGRGNRVSVVREFQYNGRQVFYEVPDRFMGLNGNFSDDEAPSWSRRSTYQQSYQRPNYSGGYQYRRFGPLW